PALDAVSSPLIVSDGYAEVAADAHRLGALVCLRAHGIEHLGPALERLAGARGQREARAREAAFEQGQRAVLEHIAAGAPLPELPIGRTRAERAIREVGARYRQIVETAYEGVWLLDAEARTLFVNQRATELLGYANGEMLGRGLIEFMDEPSRALCEGGFLQR